jgi:hypothetical protein
LLYAEWAADGSPRIAYSTGEKTPGAPGWKAHDDLNVATLTGISETLAISTTTATVPLTGTAAITVSGTTSLTIAATTPISISTRQIISPSIPAPYAWWGGRLAWTPDTRAFALGLANQVRLVNAPDGLSRVLKPFAFYDTHADWVWTPQFAWSPDSRFLAVTVHAAPEGAGLPEDSPTFDLWILSRDNSVDLVLVHNTGMWSFPTWSPRDASGESKIAYGAALNASDSERSSYALDVMNRDGSNRRQIYPTGTTGAPGGEPGLEVVQVAWSSDAAQLVAVRAGDLWLYDFSTNLWSQLTANGDTRLPQWK